MSSFSVSLLRLETDPCSFTRLHSVVCLQACSRQTRCEEESEAGSLRGISSVVFTGSDSCQGGLYWMMKYYLISQAI